MAPIGILTAVTIVVIQLLLTGYLKRRAQHDMEIAEEASRLAAESIEHVRTVQALTIQTYLNQRFCEASRKPHRRAIVRGFLQAMNYALMATFVNLNFGCAYLFGLMLVRNGSLFFL
jgi:ABC-type bacteriocin/lantibiotic exporter with double-glycine peptidase domain